MTTSSQFRASLDFFEYQKENNWEVWQREKAKNHYKKINEKYTIVISILEATSKRPQVKIDWRIYTKNPDNPLIRDLIIEGLSLARTQKEEFASVLNSNNDDIEALFKVLEEFSQN